MHVFANTNVDKETVLTALRGDGIEFERDQRVQRTWYDTFDFRLTRAGMRLEATNGQTFTVTLWQADAPPAYLTDPTVPRFASEIAPGPFRSRLAAVSGVRALSPVATLRARLKFGTKRNRSGKIVVRVLVFDDIALGDDGGAALGWAIEVDSLLGYDTAAQKLTAMLTGLGLRSDEGDLFDLGVGEGHIKPTHHDSRPQIAFDSNERALPGFRRVLGHLFETIAVNWDGTINDVDAEFLHDLRVAVRRTRSVLANAKGVIPEEERRHFSDEFRRLAAATSEPRDLDVAALGWDDTVNALGAKAASDLAPIKTALLRRRTAAHTRLERDLRSARTKRLLKEWSAWLGSAAGDEMARAGVPLRSVVNRRLARLHDRLRADALTTSPDARHTTRKDAKQLRYMVECFARLYDAAARKAFVKALTAFQDRLGQAQDATVQVALLDTLLAEASTPPETLVAVGQLTAVIGARTQDRSATDTRLFTKATERKFRALVESHR